MSVHAYRRTFNPKADEVTQTLVISLPDLPFG